MQDGQPVVHMDMVMETSIESKLYHYLVMRVIIKGGVVLPVYNKLVRDRIPEIIAHTGVQFSTKILDDQAFLKELKNKLKEELEEYLNTDNDTDAMEELADLLELIHTLAVSHGSSFEKLEEVRGKKAEKRGGFKEKIFLIETENE